MTTPNTSKAEKVSKMQMKCLRTLKELDRDGEQSFYFNYIAEKSGLTKREARIDIRALVRKGLVEYNRGLFDDEGIIAGSGHCISMKGIEFLNSSQ